MNVTEFEGGSPAGSGTTTATLSENQRRPRFCFRCDHAIWFHYNLAGRGPLVRSPPGACRECPCPHFAREPLQETFVWTRRVLTAKPGL